MQAASSYEHGDYEGRMIPGSRKRAHSPDEHSCENNKCLYTFALQSESDQPTDEDTESVYSLQLHDTASAKDTSDTSSDSSSNYVTMDVEFEVASLSEEKLWSDANSSGTDEILVTVGALAATVDDDPAIWADYSDTSTDTDFSRDSEVPRADYWTCLRCKCPNNTPLFRYCERCYQVRKDYFPDRPKRSRRRRRSPAQNVASNVADGAPVGKDQSDREPSMSADRCDSPIPSEYVLPVEQHNDIGSGSKIVDTLQNVKSGEPHTTVSSICVEQEVQGSHQTGMISDSAVESDLSQPLVQSSSSLSAQSSSTGVSNASELCYICVQSPRDGCFVHKKTVHILCCYPCTLKAWNTTGKCCLCGLKPLNIARVIYG